MVRSVSYVVILAILELLFMAVGVMADTQYVPLISVQERYDSNVLFVNPKLVPGVQVEDLVTTITPQLIMKSRGRTIDINGSIGAVGELYRNNPSLNYVGFNSSLNLGLTPVIVRVLPLATFDVFGSYQYTPQPPAFMSGPAYEGQDPYIRGIQAFRTNTTSYMAGQRATYRFTPTVTLVESYTYSKMKFGAQQVGTGLLDTTSHMVSLTPTKRISLTDEVNNAFTYSSFEQPGVGSFRTYGTALGWVRSWSDTLTTKASGGVQLLDGTFSDATGPTVQSVQQPLLLTPQARMSLTYSSNTKLLSEFADAAGQLSGLPQLAGMLMPGGTGSAGSYSLTVNYSYGAYPLFVAGGGLAKSHVFGVSGMAGLTSRLSATYGGNFARNEAASPTAQGFSFEAVSANAGLNYLITPALRAGLTYIYTNSYGIGNEISNSQGPSVSEFLTYNRQIVMLSLVYAFGGGSQFFQGGQFFGSSGGAGTGSSAPGR